MAGNFVFLLIERLIIFSRLEFSYVTAGKYSHLLDTCQICTTALCFKWMPYSRSLSHFCFCRDELHFWVGRWWMIQEILLSIYHFVLHWIPHYTSPTFNRGCGTLEVIANAQYCCSALCDVHVWWILLCVTIKISNK